MIGQGSGNGVYGYGGSNGVYGVGSGGASFGVKGVGYLGVYGESSLDGGDAFRGNAYGVTEYGINATSQQSIGVYGVTNSVSSYGGYFIGGVFSSNGVYASSDRSLKEDISDMTSGMDIIKKLAPKTYTFKHDGNYKLMHLPLGKQYGLIAQDVEQVLPNLVKVTTFETGKSTNPKQQTPSETITFKALNYTELIPIVVKGMQEMEAENQKLKQDNAAIKSELADLRKMILELKGGGSVTNSLSSAFLLQNSPNPVAGNTVIRYQIPVTATSAKLTVTNATGQLIKTITLTSYGAGQVNFSSASLSAGTYNYSLWVEGKRVDTKHLIVAGQ